MTWIFFWVSQFLIEEESFLEGINRCLLIVEQDGNLLSVEMIDIVSEWLATILLDFVKNS